MRVEADRVRRIPRSSAAMIEETCRHLCTAAASGQRYLADVAAGRADEDAARMARAEAAQARLRTCTCPA